MKITLELGNLHKIDANMAAQERAIQKETLPYIKTLLMDTKTILQGIKKQLER